MENNDETRVILCKGSPSSQVMYQNWSWPLVMSVLHFFCSDKWHTRLRIEDWILFYWHSCMMYVCAKGQWFTARISGTGFPAFFFEVDCRSTAEKGYIVYTVYMLLCAFMFTIVNIYTVYRYDISIYKKHTYMFFECLREKNKRSMNQVQ